MLKNEHITKLINLEEVKFKDIDIQKDMIRILVAPLHDAQLCPKCCRPTFTLVDIKPKVYRDLDLAGRICYIEIDLRRFECRDCFCTFSEPLSFTAPYRHYTSRFEHQVYECVQETTATYAALTFGSSDQTAWEIYQHLAKRKQEQLQSLLPTQVIGIDEIAMHKGHKDFVVVITDLTNKRVIDVLKDRKKAVLEAYMARWGEEFKKGIKFVAIDLWGPYRSVVESILPHAKAVADRFHVMQNINKALDNCTKQAKRESATQEIWKSAKYVVLKNREGLTEEQEEALSKIWRASENLRACYEFKESFRALFNDSTNREIASEKLSTWVLDIVRQKITEYYEFVGTILNFFQNWKFEKI